MPVAWRAIDQHTIVHQLLTQPVDIRCAIGQMAKVTTIRRQSIVTIPVIGQLDRAVGLIWWGHENKGETPALILKSARQDL
mgnify:CR=1 FL=1